MSQKTTHHVIKSSQILPPELTAKRRWVRWEWKGKKGKIPFQVDGRPASTTDPATWTTYEQVRAFDKIGFVFKKEDGILGIDLDHVVIDGSLCAWGETIVKDARSYTEISPSGEGLHIIAFGAKPAWMSSRVDMPGNTGIEIYDSRRFFTVTTAIFENYSKIAKIDVARIFDFLRPREVKEVKRKRIMESELRIGVHDICQGFRERVNSSHPYHGSTTGSNFMVDSGGETWRCWRHGVTGNALHLLGQREGIIECGEMPSKQQWKKIIEIAKELGLIQDHTKALMERISSAEW